MVNVDYLDLLRAQAKKIGDRRNAAHTRLRLQICAAELLAKEGLENLTVSRICKQVGLTRAGFYLHYKNKIELVADLLKGLLQAERQLMPALTECSNLYEAIEDICSWYLNFQLGAAALFATLDQAHLSDPTIGELYEERDTELQRQLIYQLSRFNQYQEADAAWGSFVLEMVGQGMYNLAQERARHEKRKVKKFIYDTDTVAKMFARMLYQALLCEPVPDQPNQKR